MELSWSHRGRARRSRYGHVTRGPGRARPVGYAHALEDDDESDVSGTIMRRAILTNTNFQDVDLTTATMTLANLSKAKNVRLKYPKRDAR